MPGIVFVKTTRLEEVTKFYLELGATIWLQQPDITILRHGNLLFGLHQQPSETKDVLLTFFYQKKEEVVEMYEKLSDIALSPPKTNKKYNIFHFFVKDPEKRIVEFQVFLHEIDYNFSEN